MPCITPMIKTYLRNSSNKKSELYNFLAKAKKKRKNINGYVNNLKKELILKLLPKLTTKEEMTKKIKIKTTSNSIKFSLGKE
jgi:hypothetical protein